MSALSGRVVPSAAMSKRPLRQGGLFERREALRAELFARQRGLCHLCGKEMTLERNRYDKRGVSRQFATFDHVIPHSEGGTTHVSNLKLAHRGCNNARNSKPIVQTVLSPQGD